MQSVCSTQTPSYHKGEILADSKNSVPAEGSVQLDHSKLPLCPGGAKGRMQGWLLRDPRQSCLSLLVKTVSASQNVYVCKGWSDCYCTQEPSPVSPSASGFFFVWFLDGEFSRKELGLTIRS